MRGAPLNDKEEAMKKIGRKLLSLLLAAVLLAALFPAAGPAVSAAGSGTDADDPMVVSTYDELRSALSAGVAYVKLGANIKTAELNDGAGYTKSIRQTGTVQLDLAGYSVTFFSRTSPLPAAIRVTGDLSVKDSRGGGKLYIDANPNTASSKQVLILAETGSFTLNSGRIGVDNGLAKNSIVVVEGKGDAKVVFNGGKVDAISPMVGIPYVYSALLSSNCKAEFNGGEFEGLVGFTYATRTDGISKPKAVINGGKFKGGIVVKKGSETITLGRSFPISIQGGSFGRGLFTENFALSSSEQTPENFAFAAMFPERTALLRPDERTRLIYRQKDVKTEYMANSVSKEYLIALSTKNLDDYKRVAFSSYSGTAYTDVCTNAFGLVKVEVNGAPAYVPHQMDVTGGYSGAPLYALNRIQFYWNPLPQAMRDAGYRQKIKYTLNGTDYPVTASSYNNNLLFQIIPVNSYSYQTEVQQLGITVELYKDGEPLRLSGASNMFLMRYRMMSETDVAIPEVTLTVKDGDLIAASAATDSPITVSEGEDCTVKSQVNWADNGAVRNKTVVLKAKKGFYLTKDTKFNVAGANSITAKWLYSTDGGQTCAVGVEAQECELITEAKGIVRGLVYYNRVNDIYVESYEPSKYTITVKKASEYVSSSGSTIYDSFLRPDELLDETGAPYYLYCTVEAKPGYVFRSGTGTLKYANEEWKPGTWAEAIWNDNWMDMDNISAGACYKLHDETDTNLGGLWLNRLELTSLNLSVKAPVAGESPAPGSDYCKIDGLPPYMKLERVDWLKCYDDWTYYSDKPFTFQTGKTSDGENCEYQCFIYVSYDISGVGVAKGAKFYLNDTPCKLDWEKKFFWTETMTAEDTSAQEDPVITAKAGANGTITPSGSVTVKKGADQTFAIQPNSGYAVSKVLVDGADVGALTSYTFKSVTANHTIEAVFAKSDTKPTNPFVDVSESAYYYDPVLWAVGNGITNGVDATHFEPDGTCTRAHAVTFLWRAAGQPEPKTTQMPFKDVKPGSYYEKAVRWAVEEGITNGTSNTTFSPDADCTRAQIVTFLWRSKGSPEVTGIVDPFTDVATAYYMDAVFWAVKVGVTNGTSPTTFSPDENCTRGQIVTFLYRAMHL